MADGFKIDGIDDVLRNLDKAIKATPVAVAAGLYQEAQGVATQSRRYTPVDTGALRASHEVGRPKFSGRDISVEISVGGPAAEYAPFVHENLQARHPVGRAKFLETALNEAKPGLAKRLGDRVVKGLG